MMLENLTLPQKDGVKIPLSAIGRLRLVFPADRIVHRSMGMERAQPMPARTYTTATGESWQPANPSFMRLLHNEFPFLIANAGITKVASSFVATSTNYGNNPYYLIRRAPAEMEQSLAGEQSSNPCWTTVRLFHLAQEDLSEPHSALILLDTPGGCQLSAVRAAFDPNSETAMDSQSGEPLPEEVLIFTAPALVWNGAWVGWERYARETYDCRHVAALQHPKDSAQIQGIQRLWTDREQYIATVLQAAQERGYGSYERLLLGVGTDADGRYLLLRSAKGTAEEVANRLLKAHPRLEAALQITEGGGTGIITGTSPDPSAWEVLGPSEYRRGRVLCCLLIEIKGS